MNEPVLALDAVLDAESTDIGGICCKKITVARYAWLEMLDSPFINFEKKFTVANLIASLYVCQLETDKLKTYSRKDIAKLEDDAMAWAETIDLSKVGPAVDFILQQFKNILKISPGTGSAEVQSQKKKPEGGMTTE